VVHFCRADPGHSWRALQHKEADVCEQEARYALVVSIETDQEDVDIYTPVLTQIAVER
jgi:hypothetical protein